MTDLRTQHRTKRRAKGSAIIATGDVVTVHIDGQPTGLWRQERRRALCRQRIRKIGPRS